MAALPAGNGITPRCFARGEPWTKYYPSHHDGHPNDAGHELWGEMLDQLLAAHVGEALPRISFLDRSR